MTRVIVTGDRNWNCLELAEQVVNRLLARYGPGLVVVHGAAAGVDRAFAEACEALEVDHEPHPAKWDELGKRAGPVRNQEMLDAGADLVVGFHRAISSSKGTKDMLRRAGAAGVPTYLVSSESGTPERVMAGDERIKS